MPGSAPRFLELERGIQGLSRAINGIGVGFLALMMFLTGTDVTLRYIFNRPIAGALHPPFHIAKPAIASSGEAGGFTCRLLADSFPQILWFTTVPCMARKINTNYLAH